MIGLLRHLIVLLERLLKIFENATHVAFHVNHRRHHMSDVVNLTTVQQVPVTIDFQNVLGSPAAVTGITLAVSDPTVLTVSPVTHSYDECVTTGNVTVDPTETDSELADQTA